MQFLTTHLEREDYKNLLPSFTLDNYIINYKCQPEVVFYIVRNSLKPIYEMEETEYNMWVNQFASVLNEHCKMNKEYFEENFDPIYLNKKKFMGDIYKNIWNYITPEFYFIFSALQLKDIFLPKIRYEAEIEKNQKKILKLTEENNNRSVSDYQIKKNKKEIIKLENCVENLKTEMNDYKLHQENISKFLEKKNNSLLGEIVSENKRDISKIFIQYCLYPRLVFSSTEALYASKMLILLIDKKMQNVNYFDMIQKFIKFLLPCIVTVTEFEALNIGYFLLEFLKIVKHWQDEKVWQEVIEFKKIYINFFVFYIDLLFLYLIY
jgi:THO complex subunit 2